MSGRKGSGVRMRTLSAVMIALTLVITAVLLINIFLAIQGYQDMLTGTERYVRAQQDAALLQQGSDYLTQQARVFTVTQDPEHVRLYFEEAQVTRSRDRAIEDIRAIMPDDPSLSYLDTAMAESMELMQVEYRAMLLTLTAMGADLAEYPQELRQTALTPAEEAMSPAEQISAAQLMMFDDTYQGHKDRISGNVRRCTEELISTTHDVHIASSEQLMRRLLVLQVLIVLMLLIAVGTVVLTNMMVIQPLRRYVANVRQAAPMDPSGAFEVRFLAENYNEMFERTQQTQDKLSYEATHDPLTGLYNRKAYESVLAECQDKEIALILLDVDYFKDVNDTHGHETGDQVLQRVAEVIGLCFRSEDAVCRIGGDEFAVVMMHVNSSLTTLVRSKCGRINEALKHPKGGVPGVTLSIGVAFSDREAPSGSLYQDADRALYAVKERGRNGCEIYSPALGATDPMPA